MHKIAKLSIDSWILCKRCILISVRNPEALVQAVVTPFFLMFLFGTIFGNIADIGDFNYIDFIVPGIVLQSIAQASQYSAVNVAIDMTKGINDRFRSMSLSRSAILIAHIFTGTLRNMITTCVIIATAFLLGYQPQGDVKDWLLAAGLLLLVNLVISILAVFCGLISKTPEASSGFMFPLFILPFISSGFAPTDSLSGVVRWFAQVQPMTSIIDSFRALTLNLPLGNSLWIALAWCAGIGVVCFLASMRVYNRKAS